MEGNLWKWTNYFSGWQPRWFVLENGILSYYRSKEDVINGCKGSIKMSVCDVHVHATDNTRLDLSIPSEAHFYVKAATPQERQEWLIALGSCKAGQPQGTNVHHSTSSSGSISEVPEEQMKSKKSELRLYCDLLMQQVHSVKTSVQGKETPDIEQLNEATSLLSATCDTFINTLDECVTLVNNAMPVSTSTSHSSHSPGIREGVGPPTPTKATMNRISPFKGYSGSQRSKSIEGSNPSGDEDGIIRGIVTPQLRNPRSSNTPSRSRNSSESSASNSSPQLSPSHSKALMGLIVENGELPISDTKLNVSSSDVNTDLPNGHSSTSINAKSRSLPVTPTSSSSMIRTLDKQEQNSHSSLDTSAKFSREQKIEAINENPSHNDVYSSGENNDDVFHDATKIKNLSVQENSGRDGGKVSPTVGVGRKVSFPEEGVRDPIQTFFSGMEVSFQDIQLFEDGGIPTTQFLSACKEIFPIFDKLNPTTFAPIKMEFTGNVRKIHQKYSTDPDHFITLQNIVLFEVKKGHDRNANSATMALLWLKRGLEFIREFLLEYMTGIQDLSQASNNAYGRSLKAFHSYVVRGVFALAAKSAPPRSAFTQSLANNPFHTKRANFEQKLLRDIEIYITANDVMVKILNDFYTQYDLHSSEQI